MQAATGLRTGRRLSHVYVMDVPSYPKPLLVTDAAINIAPNLEEKCAIVQNAIELAHDLGIQAPRVAILAAVETVNPAMQSTLDAAALCKMAERGQITGGVVDGPLAFDNAVSRAAAARRASSPRSLGPPIFSSCRTSRRATSSPSSSPSSPMPMPPASCSAPPCPSSSPAAPKTPAPPLLLRPGGDGGGPWLTRFWS